jgi:chromosome segregation ATPase
MATNHLKSHRLDNLDKQMHELKLENEILKEDYAALREEYKMLHAYKTHAESVMTAMGRELHRISEQVYEHAPSKKYESRIVHRLIPAIKDSKVNKPVHSDSESD